MDGIKDQSCCRPAPRHPRAWCSIWAAFLLTRMAAAGADTDQNRGAPQTALLPPEPKVLLTPRPGPKPRINSPFVYGCRPGHPFLFRIPCQGARPMTFAADGLPSGLKLDSATGIINGFAPKRGEYNVTLRSENSLGKASRRFRIVSGDTLALTPPMGWNDWYACYDRITDKMVREAAERLIKSGMADVGYQYVNIDDCWMNAPKNKDPLRAGPLRDDRGNFLPNKHFPDMKALTDFVHGQGLKAGIYSSPGPFTCGGFAGSYQHEDQDAQTFAAWGFDFLKYDWCSYEQVATRDRPATTNSATSGKRAPTHEELMRPYRQMGDLLKKQPRDIVFNLCQYGRDHVWEWGTAVGGHSWRTAGDLGFGLDHIFDVALANAKHRDWSKPGSWNDPDYIQIGRVGSAREMGESKPCPLTPNEQYSFMSLWCLMAAPLFYSGDMSSLDDFTVNVLCNPEVIDVDQDPLGQSARVITLSAETFLMVKDMEDGSEAVGLCNRGELEALVAVKWSDLKLAGKKNVRDLWRQKDLGGFNGEFEATVPRHGVVLIRIRPSA
jgi:alpha-galactosidase